jgi:phosphatidyl-myo-inositol dimannoside synthase
MALGAGRRAARGAAGRLTAASARLLADPAGASAMGEKGAAWVDREWRWGLVAERLAALLAG